MPTTKSAVKRVRVSARRHLENLARKNAMKTGIKTFLKAVEKKDTKASEKLSQAIAFIDKAAKARVIHKNKAAKLKSKLMKLAASKKIEPKSAKIVQTMKKSKSEKKIASKNKVEKPKAKTPKSKKTAKVVK